MQPEFETMQPELEIHDEVQVDEELYLGCCSYGLYLSSMELAFDDNEDY